MWCWASILLSDRKQMWEGLGVGGWGGGVGGGGWGVGWGVGGVGGGGVRRWGPSVVASAKCGRVQLLHSGSAVPRMFTSCWENSKLSNMENPGITNIHFNIVNYKQKIAWWISDKILSQARLKIYVLNCQLVFYTSSNYLATKLFAPVTFTSLTKKAVFNRVFQVISTCVCMSYD